MVDQRIPPRQSAPRNESFARANERIKAIRGRIKEREHLDGDQGAYISSLTPDGFEYQLKRYEVYGQKDQKHQNYLAASGWEAVELSRHPGIYVPPDQILMEKPKVLVDEDRARERMKAEREVSDRSFALTQTPPGTMTRTAPNIPRPNLTTEYLPPIED